MILPTRVMNPGRSLPPALLTPGSSAPFSCLPCCFPLFSSSSFVSFIELCVGVYCCLFGSLDISQIEAMNPNSDNWFIYNEAGWVYSWAASFLAMKQYPTGSASSLLSFFFSFFLLFFLSCGESPRNHESETHVIECGVGLFCESMYVWSVCVRVFVLFVVLSMSYGWAEHGQCDDGIDQDTCSQLGVDAEGYVSRTNVELAKFGAMGVSLMISSGDSGCHSRSDPDCTADTLWTEFPAASPYVTAVGCQSTVQCQDRTGCG